MQCSPHTTRREIKTELLAFELIERRAALDSQGILLACEVKERRAALLTQRVLLAVTVALAVVAIICALRGYHWPALATGGSSGLTAAVGALTQRRG